MKLADHVLQSFDDACAGKFDLALLHACIAIDATSKRLFPSERKVGARYTNCVRRYYWIVEPMLVGGINLAETRFSNIRLTRAQPPDLADIIYEVFRCSHAHGDEVPPNYSVILTSGNFNSEWVMADNELHMPDRIIWALLGVTVFANVNRGETNAGSYFLSLGDDRFLLRDWWGREDDFKPFATKHNTTRVKFEGLDRFEKRTGFRQR